VADLIGIRPASPEWAAEHAIDGEIEFVVEMSVTRTVSTIAPDDDQGD
jgi:hypothetical protein